MDLFFALDTDSSDDDQDEDKGMKAIVATLEQGKTDWTVVQIDAYIL